MVDNYYFNRMAKKLNPELLKEELKRFNNLLEYDFYQERKEAPEYKDLLEADDEPPADLKPEDKANSAADDVANDLGVDEPPVGGADDGSDMSGDIPEPDDSELGDDMDGDTTDAAPEPEAEPASDDVEVDVTSLVQGSEEAKKSADDASKNTQILLQKLNDLESRVASMSTISAKIDGLEQEIIKRNPTPVEKLEMRSLSSYPYSQKLTDYWADKEGPYDVMNNKEDKPKEYVLTKDDVDSGYLDSNVKKSFETKNTFTEQELKDYDEEDIL